MIRTLTLLSWAVTALFLASAALGFFVGSELAPANVHIAVGLAGKLFLLLVHSLYASTLWSLAAPLHKIEREGIELLPEIAVLVPSRRALIVAPLLLMLAAIAAPAAAYMGIEEMIPRGVHGLLEFAVLGGHLYLARRAFAEALALRWVIDRIESEVHVD